MVNFMAIFLVAETVKEDFSIGIYDPIIGCTTMFIVNQMLTEFY